MIYFREQISIDELVWMKVLNLLVNVVLILLLENSAFNHIKSLKPSINYDNQKCSIYFDWDIFQGLLQ